MFKISLVLNAFDVTIGMAWLHVTVLADKCPWNEQVFRY